MAHYSSCLIYHVPCSMFHVVLELLLGNALSFHILFVDIYPVFVRTNSFLFIRHSPFSVYHGFRVNSIEIQVKYRILRKLMTEATTNNSNGYALNITHKIDVYSRAGSSIPIMIINCKHRKTVGNTDHWILTMTSHLSHASVIRISIVYYIELSFTFRFDIQYT